MSLVRNFVHPYLPVLLLMFWAQSASLVAGDWAPVQHGIERYTHIWKSAPFTAASEVAAAGSPLAGRYAVTGFARVGGDEVVFLLDRKGLERFSVSKSRSSHGVELLALQETADLKDLKARIRVGGEIALVVYDPGTAGLPSPSLKGAVSSAATTKAPPEVAGGGQAGEESREVPKNARIVVRREIKIQP